jgi:hypothetical protein
MLSTTALAVATALARHRIRAVLTGGACACLYTGGAYQSRDMDFILGSDATQSELDAAMTSVGFRREGARYVHARARFYVEFPRGPLAIGDDHEIRPVRRLTRGGHALMLSATDSCRDRLAAFYHWNDRQSLDVAVRIACAQRVALAAIRRWSASEGFQARFEEFAAAVRRARTLRRGGRPR